MAQITWDNYHKEWRCRIDSTTVVVAPDLEEMFKSLKAIKEYMNAKLQECERRVPADTQDGK